MLIALKHSVANDERLCLSVAYSLRPTYLPRLEVTSKALPTGDAGSRRALVRLLLPIDADDSKVWTTAGDGAVHVGGGEQIAVSDKAVHGDGFGAGDIKLMENLERD